MKIACYPKTDSLYIDLDERTSSETREISPGVNLDYDHQGGLVGIDIDLACQKLDLVTVVLNHFPQETKILQTS